MMVELWIKVDADEWESTALYTLEWIKYRITIKKIKLMKLEKVFYIN